MDFSYFNALKKRLWLGKLVTDIFLLLTTAIFWPHLLKPLIFGILMGVFYLWSLMFNARYPKKGIQFVFSLIRICAFAYLIVKISNHRVPELGIVICGLLSYKVILSLEYVVQALPAFGITIQSQKSA